MAVDTIIKKEIIINVIFKILLHWDFASLSFEGLEIFKLAHLKFIGRPGFSNAEIESKICFIQRIRFDRMFIQSQSNWPW